MAKKILSSDIIEQNIFKNTIKSADELIIKLTALNTEFKTVAETTKEVIKSSKFDSVKSLNDFTKATEQATKLQKAQLQVQNELNKALGLKAKIEVQIEKSETERTRRTILQTKEQERQAKATEREIKAQSMLESRYARVNSWLNKLRAEYRDLAIKKELGLSLTEKEELRYSTLEKRIQTYDKALKGVDASMGIHNRNVGNYKSAFDGLGFSVTQLAREMPAFANSLQTGFMAISNNLPMLFDELQKIKKANVELQATGQPTTSVFKQLAGAVFSFQTLLSVGVTLLTIYGAKIVDWVSNALNPANKELEELNKKQKRIAEEQKEHSEYISKESSMYIGLVYALTQTNKGSKERIELMNNINKQYGTSLKNISDERLFQEQLNLSVIEYIKVKEAEYKLRKNDNLLQANLIKQDKVIAELNKMTTNSLKLRYESGLITQKEYNKEKYKELLNNKELIKYAKEQGLNLANNNTAQYDLINQLIELSERSKKYGLNIGNLNQVIGTNNNKTKESTETQKELNLYVSKYLEILAKIQQYRNQVRETELQDQLNKEIQKQKDSISQIGVPENSKIESILQQQLDFKLEALKKEYKANQDVREEEYKQEKKKLEQKRDTYKVGTEEYKKYQESINNLEKDYKKENELLDEQNADNKLKIEQDYKKEKQSIDKELFETWEEYQTRQLETQKNNAEKQLQQQKDTFQKLDQLAKFSADYFIAQSERKITAIDRQIDALNKQNDYMKDLAASGNINAQQSLAQNNKLIQDANKEKQKELKKQEKIKLAMTVFDSYNANLQSKELGGKNALVKTIKDVSLLQAFINSLPAFMEGTEDTGLNGKGLDGKGGFLSVLHPNERVVPKQLNEKMKGMTNLELSNLADDYLRGNVIKQDTVINTNWSTELIVSKLDSLEKAIVNKEEYKAEVGEIIGGVMHVVETIKTKNQRVRNITRI
jgi:hypothetical protein